MSHGVMVALQILVLPVQVRALVGQLFLPPISLRLVVFYFIMPTDAGTEGGRLNRFASTTELPKQLKRELSEVYRIYF